MGCAHIPAFISWMEETEYAFLRSLGMSVSMNDRRGRFGFPRLTAEIDIRRPARLHEELIVNLKIGRLSEKQIEYRFEVRPANSDSPGPIAEGRFDVACCRFPDETLPFAILIPDDVLERLERAG